MPDSTSKKLLRLLATETPVELRRAAAQVLGEVGERDTASADALCATLDDPDPEVRLHALRTVGKLRIERALGRLLQRVESGGAESEAAALSAARLGAKGTQALKGLMGRVAPGLRRRIAGALGASGTTSAETAALDALLDKDPGVVEAAVRALVGEVPSLSAGQRRSFVDRLLELLKHAKKRTLSAASEEAVLRLLSALNDPRAEAVFWERIDPAYPHPIRAAALQALGKLAGAPKPDRLKLLLRCASDTDFRVAAPAMLMLRAVPFTERNLDDWLQLLQAPDLAVRRLAIEKIADRDTARVAAALASQIEHSDRNLREEALKRLQPLRHGPAALVEALLQAETPEHTWSLARAQQGLVRTYAAGLLQELLDQAFQRFEQQDRRADALLYLLREADPKDLRDRLEKRALELRKKKHFEKALLYLRHLNRDPATGIALRFELACCGLHLSTKDLAAEARAADPSLEQFGHLLRNHRDELLPLLEKAKWLDAADLFYLGFHFTEKEREEKEFGGQVLHLAIQRSPRSQMAKDAKNKLKRAGLAPAR